jgi:hypothetical protein
MISNKTFNMEKIKKPASGLVGLLVILVLLAASVYVILMFEVQGPVWPLISGVVIMLLAFFLMK